jgi:hypothetical protein
MRKSWLLCALMGTLAWGQAAPAAPPPQPAPSPMVMGGRPQAPAALPDTSASVPADAVVITIDGVCAPQPKPAAAKGAAVKPAADAKATAPKASPADCKTTITKAEFEKLVNALAPNATMQQKKQLAGLLPRLMAMSNEAKKEGMDKKEAYRETVKFVQMQVLSNQLQRTIQDDAGKIQPAEIAAYYKEHQDVFEQFNVDRLFVPRTKQGEAEAKEDDDKDEKLTDEQKKAKDDAEKAKTDANEQAMTKLADDLRARAAGGEDIAKLQKEAFDAAGMKIESPTVNLPNIRRTGLPPGHASIFDLKAGEVSQVISDSGGHYIYKVNSKTEMPLEQATNEITGKLKNDRVREKMEKLNNSYHAQNNPDYFGPDTGPMPPPRGPRPRPGMPPAGPASQPAAPPAQPGPAAAQPPASKPN